MSTTMTSLANRWEASYEKASALWSVSYRLNHRVSVRELMTWKCPVASGAMRPLRLREVHAAVLKLRCRKCLQHPAHLTLVQACQHA